mgnify:CR=1 FL=1
MKRKDGNKIRNRKEYHHSHYLKNKDQYRERQTKWRTECRERYLESHRNLATKRRRELKIKVIAAYGGKCKCCGEINKEFLTIDHINGGGRKHIKEVGGGGAFYYWIVKNDYPKDLRLLCFNCNCSLGFYGYCPHKKHD